MKRLSAIEIEFEMEKSMSTKAITAAKDALVTANEELKAAQEAARAAAQSLHEAYEAQPHAQAEPVKHPGPVNLTIENDYRNKPGRWNGPDVTKRPAALTNEQLQAIRDAAPKPLPTFAERARAAAEKGETVKPGHTILSR